MPYVDHVDYKNMLFVMVFLLALHFLFELRLLLMIKLDMLAEEKASGYHLLAESLLPMDPDKMLSPTVAVNPLLSQPFKGACQHVLLGLSLCICVTTAHVGNPLRGNVGNR